MELADRVRPRDANVCALVGDEERDSVPFHVAGDMDGLSSVETSRAEAAADRGARMVEVRRPMTTLSRLLEQHRLERIDILKIDAEGAEGAILRGLDFDRVRPTLACIEAVDPSDFSPAWDDWEPGLLAHGYQLALFDGVNRYYVVEERGDLAERLSVPVNATDGALRFEDVGHPWSDVRHPEHGVLRRWLPALLRHALDARPADLAKAFRGMDAGPEGVSPAVLQAATRTVLGRDPTDAESATWSGDAARDDLLAALCASEGFAVLLARALVSVDRDHVR